MRHLSLSRKRVGKHIYRGKKPNCTILHRLDKRAVFFHRLERRVWRGKSLESRLAFLNCTYS